jgi:hypothetical protein
MAEDCRASSDIGLLSGVDAPYTRLDTLAAWRAEIGRRAPAGAEPAVGVVEVVAPRARLFTA